MTLYGFLSSLGWTVVTGFALWRLDQWVDKALAHHAATELAHNAQMLAMAASSRAIAQIEADSHLDSARLKYAQPASPARASDTPPIPDDLEAYVMSWDDEFAQKDERDSIRAKYKEMATGDAAETWQRVRRAVGIGDLP